MAESLEHVTPFKANELSKQVPQTPESARIKAGEIATDARTGPTDPHVDTVEVLTSAVDSPTSTTVSDKIPASNAEGTAGRTARKGQVVFADEVKYVGSTRNLLQEIEKAVERVDSKHVLRPLLSNLGVEIEAVENKVIHLEEEQEELISLVRRGQQIVDGLCEENNQLERTLTVQNAVASLSSSLVSRQTGSLPTWDDSNDSDTLAIEGHASDQSVIDEEMVKALFEERDKAEMFEEETKALQHQATCIKEELESLKVDKIELLDALEGERWLKEREELIAALEDEKDKTSTWQEEKDALVNGLGQAQTMIKQLQDEKKQLLALADTEENKPIIEMFKEDRNKAHEHEIQMLKSQLDAANQEIQELQQSINQSPWHSDKEEVMDTLKIENDKVVSLTREKSELESKVESLLESVEVMELENHELGSKVLESSWNSEREELMQALAEEKEKGSAWEEEKASLEEELKSLKIEVDYLASTNAELETALDATAWQAEKNELLSALEEAKDRFSSWQEENAALEEELVLLRGQAELSEGLEDVIQDKDNTIADLTSTMNGLKDKNDMNKDLLGSLASSACKSSQEWNTEKVELLKKLMHLKLTVSSLEEMFEEERTQHKVCESDRENLVMENDKLKKELQLSKCAHEIKKPAQKNVTWAGDGVLEMVHALSMAASLDPNHLPQQLSGATSKSPSSFFEALDQVLADSNCGGSSSCDELTLLKGLTIRTQPSTQPVHSI